MKSMYIEDCLYIASRPAEDKSIHCGSMVTNNIHTHDRRFGSAGSGRLGGGPGHGGYFEPEGIVMVKESR